MSKDKTKPRFNGVYKLQLAAFSVTLTALCILGLILPLRPEESEVEKRKLAEFPKFSLQSLFSGEYFSGVGEWYSDTFPGREFMISLNSKIKSYYGKSDMIIHGDVEKSDEIPDEYIPPDDDILKEFEEGTTQPEVNTEPSKEEQTENNQPPSTRTPSQPSTNVKPQSFGGVLVYGNKAYEYYNFNKNTANQYIAVVNKQAENLKGKANVYDIIVPTSIGITLPDEIKSQINSSDQKKAIDYFYSGLSADVKKVDVYNTLMSHRNEYIYFNTDHHWTALGAYYAYEQYAVASGKAVLPLDFYTQVKFDNFLGTFYGDTGKLPELENNPDTVYAYKPNSNATMYYVDKSGNKHSWPIIMDVSKYGKSMKYNTFIGGDNPFTEITNPNVTDGSSVVVVKESFGNAFVPFLVENYNKVYVIDYRYYGKSISNFVTENNVKDVIYINNISATRNASLVKSLYSTL